MNQIELSAGTIEYQDTGGKGPVPPSAQPNNRASWLSRSRGWWRRFWPARPHRCSVSAPSA